MAGTFTHWMIVEDAMDNYLKKGKRHPYFQFLMSSNHFAMLGAVSPDLPYLTELLGGYIKTHSWADRMHYENTGRIVSIAIKRIQGLPQKNQSLLIPWLAGYVSHLITDSIIHPIVNSIVGPYHFNATEHRHCEMTQDSLIFHEIKGLEISNTEYARLLTNCNTGSSLNMEVSEFWKKCLIENYPSAKDFFNNISPIDWHRNYVSAIASASNPTALFRHLGDKANLVYKKTNEITTEEKNKFYSQVKLPVGKPANFKEAGFDKASTKVIEVWDLLFQDIQANKPENCAHYIKNWNLDTGVNEDQPDFWRSV